MIRSKLGIAILLLMVVSNCALAGSKACNYPKHIKIDGPPGTGILELKVWSSKDVISVFRTSKASFDIIDNFDCLHKGVRVIYLNVGTDSDHYSIQYFRTESEGNSRLEHMAAVDENLTQSTIDKLNDTDYKFTYTYKSKE